jgi:hypothetical protein
MTCDTCHLPLDDPKRAGSEDCGGTCSSCMAAFGDPDALASIIQPVDMASFLRIFRDSADELGKA